MHLIDVKTIISEVAFIIQRTANVWIGVEDQKRLSAVLETIIVEYLNEILESEENTLLPRKINRYQWIDKDSSLFICNELQLPMDELRHIITIQSRSFNEIVNIIYSTIKPDSFDIWEVKKFGLFYFLYYIGDFRILEWENDHIDCDGNYVNVKRQSTEPETIQRLIDREIDQHNDKLKKLGLGQCETTWDK